MNQQNITSNHQIHEGKNILKLDFPFRYRENIVIPNFMGPPKIKTNEEKLIESTVESCFFKSFMACVLGNEKHSTQCTSIRTIRNHF